MANEHQFRFHLGGAVSYEAAQSDPNASLGSFQSSVVVADYEGAVTGINSDREIVDSSLPGTSFVGGWVVFLDTNLNEAREIIAHDTGTDTLTFREVLPATPLVTDRFWVFAANGLFDSMDADLCRRRATRYRLVFMKNETAADLDSCRIYVRDIQPGPILCDVAMATVGFPQGFHWNLPDIADEETTPGIDSPTGGFGDAQEFKNPRDYDRAVNSPFGREGPTTDKTIRALASNRADRPFWIRLQFDVDSPIPLPSQAVFQIFVDSDDGVTVSSMIVVVDIDGVPETIVPVVDRRLRVAGGARLSCIVTDSLTPFEPVPGRTIRIELASGPGSVNAQNDTVQRPALPPADGEPIRRVYVSPTDPAEEGASVQFDFEVT